MPIGGWHDQVPWQFRSRTGGHRQLRVSRRGCAQSAHRDELRHDDVARIADRRAEHLMVAADVGDSHVDFGQCQRVTGRWVPLLHRQAEHGCGGHSAHRSHHHDRRIPDREELSHSGAGRRGDEGGGRHDHHLAGCRSASEEAHHRDAVQAVMAPWTGEGELKPSPRERRESRSSLE